MGNDPEAVMGATDVGFIANLYYAASAEIVAKAAAVLGREKEAREYRALAEEQYGYVKDEYYSRTGRCCVKTQTALLLTLKYGLSDNVELTKTMLRQLFADADFKLRTGFVGTPLMCNILSDAGMEDIAWKLLLNEDYPGWLHEIKLGATTVWERWNSLLDDGTISGISMNSMNHYAYGSIVEWLFRHAAGLNVSEAHPGCRHLKIAPSLNWSLREQETVYDSPAGEYRSAWKLVDPTHVELSVTVPFGCTAGLMLCAKTQEAAAELSGQITEGRFQKEYLAVAEGCAEEGGALYDLLFHERTKNKTYVVSRARRGVKQALLHYERLAYCEGLSLLRVRLETGRTHQIRVQFASRGLPLAGDGKYGAQNRRCPLALFSCALSFRHPKTGEALRFDALPEEAWPWTLFSEALRSGEK